jgi:uncharacterized protein YcgI (DUF1989 family)
MAREVINEFIVSKCTGKAFIVKKGKVLRIIEIGGRQIASVTFFNAHNYKEQLGARNSVMLESFQLKAGRFKKIDTLYSKVPWERVMLTVVDDTVGEHTFGSPCSRKFYEIMLNNPKHQNCFDNLSKCLMSYGILSEDLDSGGTFNVFMREVVDEDQTIHIEESLARDGDHIDLLAEMDVLVALSACPAPPPINDNTPKDVKVQILQ